MKSHSLRMRLPASYDLPIRLRPWFIAFTAIVMLTLAFLGFTNFSHSLPLNDKFLHFICFLIATTVFFFMFDVEEDYRRIWFWRYSGLIITGFTCISGGILSEIVQSMLPYKEFQAGDIMANLLGSSIGLYVAYHMERYYRSRREIARLYRPLDTEILSDDEDDDNSGTQLLPTHTQSHTKGSKSIRRPDVWDADVEREELFGIGDDSDVEGEPSMPGSHNASSRTDIPKITVTDT